MDPISKPEVKLVASTTAYDARPASKGASRTGVKESRVPPAFFYKSAQWTADGTTVITSSSDDRISTFVLPEDLLEARDQPLALRPQHTLTLPEPTHVVAPAPYFSLAYPLTQTLLVACRDHPIQLHHALPLSSSSPSPGGSLSPSPSPVSSSTSPALSTFNLINHQTEAYLTPTALVWPAPGTHFVAGTTNLLASFDVTRPGSGPVLRVPTIPSKRHISKGNGVGMRGTVSALACAPPTSPGAGAGAGVPGLVAAGTWTRWVGLYDLARAGDCVATWGVAAASRTPPGAADDDVVEPLRPGAGGAGGGTAALGGQGILQTVWSPCGRYLVLNERQSAGLLVYDVRVTGRLLSWLVGRDALTHQRLTCDVYPGGDGSGGGFEVWAGTRTGSVQVWDRVGMEEGRVGPAWGWDAHGEGSPVGSAAMHGSGSVVATCSGGWSISDDDCDDDSDDGDESSASSEEGGADEASGDGSSSTSSASSVGSTSRRTPTITRPDHSLKIWSIGLGSGSANEPLE